MEGEMKMGYNFNHFVDQNNLSTKSKRLKFQFIEEEEIEIKRKEELIAQATSILLEEELGYRNINKKFELQKDKKLQVHSDKREMNIFALN